MSDYIKDCQYSIAEHTRTEEVYVLLLACVPHCKCRHWLLNVLQKL